MRTFLQRPFGVASAKGRGEWPCPATCFSVAGRPALDETMSPAPDRSARRSSGESVVRDLVEPRVDAASHESVVPIDRGSLSPAHALRLQPQFRNQAVQRMLGVTSTAAIAGAPVPGELTPAEGAALQRWDWGGAAVGALGGAAGGGVGGGCVGGGGGGGGAVGGGLIGGGIGAGIGALAGGLIGGVIGGLVTRPTVDPAVALRRAAESVAEIGGTANEADRQAVV